ncbi:MAG: nucleotide sugar dehydrogenase [Planctomycetota bacterium]
MADDPTRTAVVGLGYVGLPLAVTFAKAGFEVLGIDSSKERVAEVQAGKAATPDVAAGELAALVETGRITASLDFAEVRGAELVSICVPTPLSKSKDPDISHIVSACESLAPYLSEGTVVVLESTTYPGTTREIILPRFESEGFTVGEDLFLAFAPERVDPGNPDWNIANTPKVLGGVTEACGRKARELYSRALDEVHSVSSAEAAEMVKLLENTFRSVNIGLVNELAMVCERLGVSVWEVIEAASTKPFGFMPFRPGPGLGGHCIPIDPLYLSWKMRTLDYKVRFIDLADEVNSSMPAWVIGRVTHILNLSAKALRGSRILVLGVAYKANVDDVRESPAIVLYEKLGRLGAELQYHDPHVPRFDLEERTVEGIGLDAALAGRFDLILIVTAHDRVDHDAFADLRIPVLDARNALRGRHEPHIHRL